MVQLKLNFLIKVAFKLGMKEVGKTKIGSA